MANPFSFCFTSYYYLWRLGFDVCVIRKERWCAPEFLKQHLQSKLRIPASELKQAMYILGQLGVKKRPLVQQTLMKRPTVLQPLW